MNPVAEGAIAGIRLTFQGDPLDWAERHVHFPSSARSTKFDRTIAPWWNDIILDHRNPNVRQTYVRACTGAGKSTALEALTCLIIAEDPGPMLAITQTDQTSAEWMETRLRPALESCQPVRALWPRNRHAVTKSSILFPHMSCILGGANVSNAQEKSVKHLMLDEAWTYSELIGQFKARHHDRWDRKTLIVTQAHESPHSLDDEWDSGEQFAWCHQCVGCSEWIKPDWSHIAYDDTRDLGELVASVRHACPHCQHATPDTVSERRAMTNRSRWISEGNQHIEGHRSRHVPAQAVWWIKWSDLVLEWVKAQKAKKLGMLAPLKDFRMNRQAIAWRNVDAIPEVEMKAAEYLAAELSQAPLEGEITRIMTVDVQQDSYWAVIRSWLPNGHSKLVWCGKVLTLDELRDTQTRFNVQDSKVALDAGNNQHGSVYDRCARFGWLSMIGRADNSMRVINPQTGRATKSFFSNSAYAYAPTHKTAGKPTQVIFLYWCSDPIKDILAELRRLGAPTWEFPKDVPDDYVKHMNSEYKRETINKQTKRLERRWTSTNRQNHLWDCEAMQVALALRFRLLPDLSNAVEQQPST